MNNKEDNFKEKLRLLMQGLEFRKIDEFIESAPPEAYFRLGEDYTKETNWIIQNWKSVIIYESVAINNQHKN